MKKKTPVTEQADGGSADKSNSQAGKGPGSDIGQQAEPGGGTAAALFKLKGKVLVVGGYDQFDKPLFTAELFDSGTGTWASTGSLFHERAGHGATLLLDGKVLVAGGSSNDKSVEVYNPATGEWFSVGRLLAPRNYTTATLLQNGRVLVAGGGAELYDPATMVWTLTGNPKNPRFLHTATRLHNGKVLIVGGSPIESGGFSNTAELYDPATGLWNPTGNLFFDRFGHTATLLRDGKVLVTGGTGPALPIVPWTVQRSTIPPPASGLPWADSMRRVNITRPLCCRMARCWWQEGCRRTRTF